MSRECPWGSYKDLPTEFKNKPTDVVFKLKNGRDAVVTYFNWCDNCGHHVDRQRTCTSCDNKKLRRVYDYSSCGYRAGSCPVNSWGCSIHYRKAQHPFTCTCDTCY